MILTLFYAGATILQSWRLRSITLGIANRIRDQCTISFYRTCTENEDGFVSIGASSEACENYKNVRVVDTMWYHNMLRGVTILPKQHLVIDKWVTFNNLPSNLNPLYSAMPIDLDSHADTHTIHILLETQIYPDLNAIENGAKIVAAENFGLPIAWKIDDTNLAIVLESNVTLFTELIRNSFIQDTLFINNYLSIIRIENVSVNGTPLQLFDFESSSTSQQQPHSDSARTSINPMTESECRHHLDKLRILNLVANLKGEPSPDDYEKDICVLIGDGPPPPPPPLPVQMAANGSVCVAETTTTTASIENSMTVAKQQLINGSAGVAEWIQNVEPDTSQLDSIAHISKTPSPSAKIGNATSPTTTNHNRLGNGIVHMDVSDVGTIGGSSRGSQDLLDIQSIDVEKSLESVITVDATTATATATKDVATAFTPSDHENNDVFLENTVEPPAIKLCDHRRDSEKKKCSSDDFSDKKTIKTGNSSIASSSECHSSSQYSTLKRKKRNSDGCKPPNVLVYSESNDTRSNVISAIKNILHPDRYTIYELKTEQLKSTFWIDNTTLLIVCGPISTALGSILMEYFLCGGKMLCLCSDVLNMVLPMYRTAEVRENELVQFSYGHWHNIKLMHHIFCYHPSPIKKHFSSENDEQPATTAATTAATATDGDEQQRPPLYCPGSIDLKDLHGDIHRLEVKVLGTEETWNTPSLILATDTNCNGIAVFSQVHLEADPNLYEHDDMLFTALRRSDHARLEIFSDLLSTQLGLIVQNRTFDSTNMYPNAFFLGRHEAKFELLEKLRPQFIHPNTLKTKTILVKFYGKNEAAPKAALENTLPILLHSCPEDFSTISYFETLKTREIGRLTIYAPLINSTMTLVSNLNMRHGLAVIGRKQTAGVGRNKNQWLSPEGCALFSLQLHIPLSSPLGQKIPLLQHLVAMALVHSITKHDQYKKLDIRLKWPNDIYVNGNTKIGGLVVNTELCGTLAICNVGVGFNLNNSIPTTCVNDLIKTYNLKHNTDLPYLEYEHFFANAFNEIEALIDVVQTGNFHHFYDLYYKLWLHSDAEIVIIDVDGHKKLATIIGIDDYGYLLVKQPNHEPESVHPDGNTFDILRGLISAKHF